MISRSTYSPAEYKLIEHFGFMDVCHYVTELGLYRMMVEKAFLDNDQTQWADGLRRVYKAYSTANLHRMTPEWDRLILGE